MPCDWDEVSGTWSCGTTTDANAILRYRNSHPDGAVLHRVYGSVSASAEGGQAIFFVNYKDSMTYLAGRLTISDTCGKVELLQDGSVLETLNIEPLPVNQTHFLCVLFNGQRLSAHVAPGADDINDAPNKLYRHVAAAVTPDPEGIWVAIGTGANGDTVAMAPVVTTPYSDEYPQCDTCDTCQLSDTFLKDPADSCEWQATGSVTHSVVGGLSTLTMGAIGDSATYKGNDGATNAFAQAYVKGTVSGQKLRMYVNDGPWAEVEFHSSVNMGKFRISGGQETTLTLTPNTEHLLTICLDGTSLRAMLDYSPSLVPPVVAALTGTVTASSGKNLVCELLGANGTATFRGIAYARLNLPKRIAGTGSSALICGICYGSPCQCCDPQLMPATWIVEVENIAGLGCCPNYNGAYVLDTTGPCGASVDLRIFGGIGVISACDVPGFVNLGITCTPTHVTFTVGIGPIANNYPSIGAFLTYKKTLPRPVACTQISQLELDFDSFSPGAGTQCDYSSVVVRLSAG